MCLHSWVIDSQTSFAWKKCVFPRKALNFIRHHNGFSIHDDIDHVSNKKDKKSCLDFPAKGITVHTLCVCSYCMDDN